MENLARYNAHKRATLDRVTEHYRRMLSAAFTAEMVDTLNAFLDALERGERGYRPRPYDPNLDRKILSVFRAHQEKIILVAVSDGIQEVSPENKLGAWRDFPDYVPIERTLGVALATKRSSFIDQFRKERDAALRERLATYVSKTKSTHLQTIRRAYAKAARAWFSGDDDVDADDVKDILVKAFKSTDHYGEMVLRTETTNYFNEARLSYFETATAVDYMQLYAVTDGRISDICNSRNGYVIPIARANEKKYMPAFHPHCRTIQRPLMSSITSQKTLIEKGLRMNEARFEPLPKGWA